MYSLKLYLHSLTLYDYIGIGWLVLLTILFISIGFYFINKRVLLSISLLIFSFLFLIFGFFGLKYFLSLTVRKSVLKIEKIKPLHYTKSVIIKGEIQNRGKIDFKECILDIKIIKISKNRIKNIINDIKPIAKRSILIEREIKKDQDYKFTEFLNGVSFKKDYNISAKAECY